MSIFVWLCRSFGAAVCIALLAACLLAFTNVFALYVIAVAGYFMYGAVRACKLCAPVPTGGVVLFFTCYFTAHAAMLFTSLHS